MLSLRDTMDSLAKILKMVEVNRGAIAHLETRESSGDCKDGKKKEGEKQQQQQQVERTSGVRLDALVRIDIRHGDLMQLVKALKRCPSLASVSLVSSRAANVKCELNCRKKTHCILPLGNIFD